MMNESLAEEYVCRSVANVCELNSSLQLVSQLLLLFAKFRTFITVDKLNGVLIVHSVICMIIVAYCGQIFCSDCDP